jgi:hypothetical protein
VLSSKEELPVEIAQINGVKVDNVYLAKAGEHQILQQLAAYAASPDQQHPRLFIFHGGL